MNIRSRLNRIEDKMPDGDGRCYVDIWSLTDAQWTELAAWAMGETETIPYVWPSEEEAAEARRREYTVQTRQELREICEMFIEIHRKCEAVPSGIDYESIGIGSESIE